jgi:hypothetical protein
MQFDRLDQPLAVRVLGGGNLAAFDGAQDRRLVQAGRCGSCCEGVGHGIASDCIMHFRASWRAHG